MKQYVLDANAVVRYIREAEGFEKVRAILRQREQGQASISMSVINLGEAYYVVKRHVGEAAAIKTVQGLGHAVSFVPVDLEQAIAAATIKEKFRLGYADSFAAVLAMRSKSVLVTADPAFERLGRSISLLKLPRHGNRNSS